MSPWIRRSVRIALMLLCGAIIFSVASLFAHPRAESFPLAIHQKYQTTTTANTSEHVTIIVLDMSGSMQENDPNGIRCSAANAFIDLSGPGDFIGVVNLDAGASPDLAVPVEMSTLAARNGLKDDIRTKTHNCQPDGDTPTSTALEHAEAMLRNATNGGSIPGSVILLTDGIPAPNPTEQQNHIRNDLVPQFQQNNWPIDTIALGQPDQSFHDFLNGVARGTGGQFFDDGHGVAAGVNPLNIASFFIQIFTNRVGHSQGPSISPTGLNGGTVSRDFTLASNENYFAVIIVKDQADAQVTLIDPNGIAAHAQPGLFVSTDPRYVMYIITDPQAGNWIVRGTGSGAFLAESLIDSSLQVDIQSPLANGPVLPLGAPITISARLTDNGAIITHGYTVRATLAFVGDTGGAQPYKAIADLPDPGGSGASSDTMTVPTSELSGSYLLTVCVFQGSGNCLTSSTRTISLALFPSAVLFDHNTHIGDPVSSQVIAFDKGLQVAYGAKNPIVNWLSQGPLNHQPAVPTVTVSGQVQLAGNPYCNARVKGSARLVSGGPSVPIIVTNMSCGNFQILFPAGSSGSYEVSLESSGSFKDSLGAFGPATVHRAIVTVNPATKPQEIRAWLWTLLLYPLEAFIIISVIRSRFMPDPAKHGVYRVKGGQSGGRGHPIEQNSLYWRLMQRNIVPSESVFKKPGMALLVDGSGVVKARRARWPWIPGRNAWFTGRNEPLSGKFTPITEVYTGFPTNPHYVFGGGGVNRPTLGLNGPKPPSAGLRGGSRGGPPPKRPGGPPPPLRSGPPPKSPGGPAPRPGPAPRRSAGPPGRR